MVDHVKDVEGGTVTHADDEDSESEGEVSIRKGVLFLIVGGFLITVFSEPFIGYVVLNTIQRLYTNLEHQIGCVICQIIGSEPDLVGVFPSPYRL